jgi:hypothetical protein
MLFEFGETEHNKRFFDRLPKFVPTFQRLVGLSNKILGRESHPTNRAEDVCFGLAHTCREDYFEVLFLAANGHGEGALKLLRGLYERAVTLAYIARHPEKADRFLHFAAIQEYRATKAALRVVMEEQFDAALGVGSVSRRKEAYEQFKPEFRGRELSWDVGLGKMVEELGDPYDRYYLGSYTIPNFRVHATVASTFDGTAEGIRAERNIQNADFALLNATSCLLLALREQNRIFDLRLDGELQVCEEDLVDVFVTR